MTKPDDVPQDVWDAAVACSKDMKARDMRTGDERPEVYIARAITAEQEKTRQMHRRAQSAEGPQPSSVALAACSASSA